MEGNLIGILDPDIERTPATLGAMARLAVLSFACSAPSKKDRPSMKKSVEVLWNIRKDYLAKKQANLNLSTTKTASMHCDSFHNTPVDKTYQQTSVLEPPMLKALRDITVVPSAPPRVFDIACKSYFSNSHGLLFHLQSDLHSLHDLISL